ncbi:hypothetical protein KUCAC02_009383, partial [Chaenocephalus aceratus]
GGPTLQSLKHRINTEGYSELCSQLSSPSFKGVDSFYVRVNLNMEPNGDPLSLGYTSMLSSSFERFREAGFTALLMESVILFLLSQRYRKKAHK